MVLKSREMKIVTIVGLFLISIFVIALPTTDAREREGLIEFPAYIKLDVDVSPLQKPLIVDQVVTLPINITYSHGVPMSWYRLIPGTMLRNQFFFGSAMAPQVLIKLEVINKPEWANIYFSQSDLLFSIPDPEKSSTMETELNISPYREAPAQPYTITIRATSQHVGKVQSFSIENSYSFTPTYIPMISIEVERPLREISPREIADFTVKITNNANKKTIVKCSYIAPNEWAPVITPSEIELDPKQTGKVIFSVRAPYTLGWHDVTTSMQIICKPYPSPITPETNLTYYEIAAQTAYVQLTNYGFSISGSEPFLVVVGGLIVVIILFLLFKFKLKK